MVAMLARKFGWICVLCALCIETPALAADDQGDDDYLLDDLLVITGSRIPRTINPSPKPVEIFDVVKILFANKELVSKNNVKPGSEIRKDVGGIPVQLGKPYPLSFVVSGIRVSAPEQPGNVPFVFDVEAVLNMKIKKADGSVTQASGQTSASSRHELGESDWKPGSRSGFFVFPKPIALNLMVTFVLDRDSIRVESKVTR